MHKSHSSQRDVNALPVPQLPMSLSQTASDLRYSSRADRVVSQKESHLVTAILMRRQPSVEVYGVMMSPDGSEKVGSLIRICFHDLRLWRSVLRVPFSRRFHWRWMTSVVTDRNQFALF